MPFPCQPRHRSIPPLGAAPHPWSSPTSRTAAPSPEAAPCSRCPWQQHKKDGACPHHVPTPQLCFTPTAGMWIRSSMQPGCRQEALGGRGHCCPQGHSTAHIPAGKCEGCKQGQGPFPCWDSASRQRHPGGPTRRPAGLGTVPAPSPHRPSSAGLAGDTGGCWQRSPRTTNAGSPAQQPPRGGDWSGILRKGPSASTPTAETR